MLMEKNMELKENPWIFPENIEFEEVTNYLKKFDKMSHNLPITFDLSETENIHSSFIGFLIHAKRKIDNEKGKLVLIISPSLEKIFTMLNMNNYWVYTCIRKIA
jgi:anti-anti-sigma regulatory factor